MIFDQNLAKNVPKIIFRFFFNLPCSPGLPKTVFETATERTILFEKTKREKSGIPHENY